MDNDVFNRAKSFHLIKLIGQLIRNSPIAFDGQQKADLIRAGFSLSLRVVSLLGEMCSLNALKSEALNTMREKVLKVSDRIKIEAHITGLVYHLQLFTAFMPIRHACFFLAHPDLSITYDSVFGENSSKSKNLSHKILLCGLNYELRAPDPQLLKKTYHQLSPAGQDLLHIWTCMFLSFNRVTVPKRQAILESVDMKNSIQLLLPKGSN